MMRSMYSAISGLKAHQTKMDVIGNNIANVNTIAYKGSRVQFKEVFSQTIKGASAAEDGRGGTNPMQVGLGIDIASIDNFQTIGSIERTEAPTDIMIDGEGFFMVSDDPNFNDRYYTRAGNFQIDDNGNLLTGGGGFKVLGYRVKDGSIGPDAELNDEIEGLLISKATVFPAKCTGEKGDPSDPAFKSNVRDVQFEGNIDANTGLDAKITTKDTDSDGNDDQWRISKSSMRARQTTFTVYDEMGGEHIVKMSIRRTLKTEPPVEDGDDYVFENLTDPVNPGDLIEPNKWKVELEYVGDASASLGTTTFDLNFDSDGNVSEGDMTNVTLSSPTGQFPNGAGTFNFNLSFKDEKGNTIITQASNDSSLSIESVNGYKQGALDDFSIGENGDIMGNFTNGKKSILGKLVLSKFKNAAGLEKVASNMYAETANSGIAIMGFPGSNGFGPTIAGALEMSNVDLSREFTNMIQTQRGFQANSRIINTTDQMLEELINLKR